MYLKSKPLGAENTGGWAALESPWRSHPFCRLAQAGQPQPWALGLLVLRGPLARYRWIKRAPDAGEKGKWSSWEEKKERGRQAGRQAGRCRPGRSGKQKTSQLSTCYSWGAGVWTPLCSGTWGAGGRSLATGNLLSCWSRDLPLNVFFLFDFPLVFCLLLMPFLQTPRRPRSSV